MFESWSGRHKFKDLRSAIADRFLFARVLPGLFYGLWRCIQRRTDVRCSPKQSFKSLIYEHFDRPLSATSGHSAAHATRDIDPQRGQLANSFQTNNLVASKNPPTSQTVMPVSSGRISSRERPLLAISRRALATKLRGNNDANG